MDGSKRIRETAPEYMAQCVRLTLDDYRRLPSGLRYELVEGVLRQMTFSTCRGNVSESSRRRT